MTEKVEKIEKKMGEEKKVGKRKLVESQAREAKKRRKQTPEKDEDDDGEEYDKEEEEEEEGNEEDNDLVEEQDVVVLNPKIGRVSGSRKWEAVFSRVDAVDGPSSFEAAMTWVVKDASRNEMHQLIGALNLPTTPSRIYALTHFRNWWSENRTAFLTNKDEFIESVRQTYERRRTDALKTVRARESQKNKRQRQIGEFAERFANDHLIMSKADFIFAIIYPVDHFYYQHGYLYGANSQRRAEDKYEQSFVSYDKNSHPLASLCPPVLCRVKVTNCPPMSGGYISVRRAWNHQAPQAEISLLKMTMVKHLERSPDMMPDNKRVADNFDVGSTMAKEQSSDPCRIRVVNLKPSTIKVNGPGFKVHRDEQQLFEWTVWLKTPRQEKKDEKKEETKKTSLDPEATDPGASDDEEVAEIVSSNAADDSSIGVLKLIPSETDRYNILFKQFHKFQHVTTIQQIWQDILEFQISY